MARYKKTNCDVFVNEIQGNVDFAKQRIKEKFNELEFQGAQERLTFELYYSQIITELEIYRAKVGSYHFLPT